MCTISQSLSYIWSFTVLSPQGMWIMQVCLVFAGGLIWKQVSITHDCLAMLWPNFTIDMNKMFGVKSNSERRLAIIYTDSWFCLWGLKNQWSVYTELPQAFEPSRVQKLYTMWGNDGFRSQKLLALICCPRYVWGKPLQSPPNPFAAWRTVVGARVGIWVINGIIEVWYETIWILIQWGKKVCDFARQWFLIHHPSSIPI